MKAKTAEQARILTDIPNIGPAMVRDFTKIGINSPTDLVGADSYTSERKRKYPNI